jgi:hypothetical protein
VYVDANSPAAIGRRLARAAVERDFTLARSTHFLSPNEARNLGFARVRTKYTVFLGNDVFVTDGWLESLVECAEETGAAFVGGVSCWGEHGAPVVYCAGGESHLVDRDDGTRGLHDVHHGANRPLVEERLTLRRVPSEAAVFHCMLVRSEVVDRLGGMDEDLYVLDHVDWCLRAQHEAGGGWFEPRSVVRYSPPSPPRASDVPYGLLRWSRSWIESSCARFCDKWGVDPTDPGLGGNVRWMHEHRWRMFGRGGEALRQRCGDRMTEGAHGLIDAVVTNTLVRAHARRHARQRPAAVDVVSARGRSTP